MSLSVECADQAELDRLWDALVAGGAPIQCGWLNDRYGVPWQIVPKRQLAMMADPDREKAARAMTAMLGMVKLDIAALEDAFEGR
jgi:predicted 3-demethylubiquinone-9 3-methyltransferase (glyoxalase superfamily)